MVASASSQPCLCVCGVNVSLKVNVCVCVLLRSCSCEDRFVQERGVVRLWEVARFDFLFRGRSEM